MTIDLSDSQFQKLQNLAKVHGIEPEVLLKASLDDWLNLQQGDFANAADYVLEKNAMNHPFVDWLQQNTVPSS